MTQPPLREVAAGAALKLVLDLVGGRPPEARGRRRLRAPASAASASHARPRPGLPRGPLALATACLVIGLPVMLIFENTIARVIGVAALLGFIVSGVFAVATPGLLGEEEEEPR
jgi:hypothetical protein